MCLSQNYYFIRAFASAYAHTELFKAICIPQSTHPHLAILFLYEVMKCMCYKVKQQLH
jgi:hypothetical protein